MSPAGPRRLPAATLDGLAGSYAGFAVDEAAVAAADGERAAERRSEQPVEAGA